MLEEYSRTELEDEIKKLKEENFELRARLASFERHEFKETETEIHLFLRRFNQVIDNITDGILLADIERMSFIAGNRVICDMLGYDLDEILDLSVPDIHPLNSHALVFEKFRKQISKEIAVAEDIPILRKDGTIFHADVTSTPISFLGKEVMLGVFHDITERKKKDLRISNKKLLIEGLLDTIPNPVFYKDKKGVYLGCNSAFADLILGLDKNEIIDKSLYDFPEQIPKTLADLYRLKDNELLTKPGKQVYESQVMCSDGKLRDFIFYKATFNDSKGCITGLIGVMLDISDLKEAHNKLVQAQKMEVMSRLIGAIAHDFNNIMHSIGSATEMISFNLENSRVTDNLAAQIIYDLGDVTMLVQRGSEIIKNLLGFSKQGKYFPQEIDINQEAQAACKLFRKIMISDHISLIETRFKALSLIRADKAQLQQILNNLLINAQDAMPEGGACKVLTVDTELEEDLRNRFNLIPKGRYVMLAVADEGAGIAEKDLNVIFDYSYTTKSKGGGMGWGLATVKAITENHGAFLDVLSKLGQGSEFRIYFPAGRLIENMHETEAEKKVRHRPSILIVDDEKMIIRVLSRYFGSKGYDVRTAENGLEAFGFFKNQDFDIVLTDIIMDPWDGYKLFYELKKLNPSVRVVLMSGYENDAKVQELLENGALGFINKPFELISVFEYINKLLEN